MGGTAAERRISVGYVRRAHGIKGDVIVRPLTDNPERFEVGRRFLTDEDPPRTLVIRTIRTHNDGELIGFVESVDRNTAEALQGVTLTIAASERRDLGEDEFWPEDLQGLIAVNLEGDHLGTVTGVVLGAAQDRLVITTPSGTTVEVPFVEALVGEIHPSLGHVVVNPPHGLI